MNVSVIGTGDIGSQLARSIAVAQHSLTMANSRGPETLDRLAAELLARAATTADAVVDADVIVLSIPFAKMPSLAEDLTRAPASAVIVDMSNYYALAGVVDGLEHDDPSSAWVSEQIGRPVIKAWNTIFSRSLALKREAPGTPERLALPVAGDDVVAKATVMQLVEDTGFDAVDAGSLADSWRMQPGTPAYCTDLDAAALRAALARADRSRMAVDAAAEIAAVYRPGTGIDMVNGVEIYRNITA
ncbi:NAD(P)-binding domain-containing protein [Cellulomonas sp. ACRRI]|uniref:NADPH-dependent F420 reductase n=1 Tax=Cellulomonas sp. ACRRI TaxID=2918188 RepID=UPI001EF179A4|nr:NAD(P)-binding domain-containing protein [Cellulomonas sp. ACRRI]MCG7284448.1 NAD(P)-binding domain-containing protein [Cellulomonas sp. ACRRI]